MKTLKFVKMTGSGNDFIIVDKKGGPGGIALEKWAPRLCDRRYGAGADGVLVLEKDKTWDFRMRIFNSDGSEAEMCGNGARCLAFYYARKSRKKDFRFQTQAGVLRAKISGSRVALGMTDPLSLRQKVSLDACGRSFRADFIDTGVPHVVIMVDDLEKTPVFDWGRQIRYHGLFQPRGTNVNFLKEESDFHVAVRTYERGVEDETLACGTGSVASAIIYALNKRGAPAVSRTVSHQVFVRTRGGEVLKVLFKVKDQKIFDVWLQGEARLIYKGEYYFQN